MNATFKLLCQKTVYVFKGNCVIWLGEGEGEGEGRRHVNHVWAAFVIMCWRWTENMWLISIFLSQILFPSLKCNLRVKTTLLIVKQPPLPPHTNYLLLRTSVALLNTSSWLLVICQEACSQTCWLSLLYFYFDLLLMFVLWCNIYGGLCCCNSFCVTVEKTDCYLSGPLCSFTVGFFRRALWMHYIYDMRWCVLPPCCPFEVYYNYEAVGQNTR